MASRKDECINEETAQEIQLKKIEKRRKEKKRVEKVGLAYRHLANKLSRHSTRGCRKRPSRLALLESTLSYVRALKKKLADTTHEGTDCDSSFQIAAPVRGRSSSSGTASSQYSSPESEATPTPIHGAPAANMLPIHLEQVSPLFL